MPQHSAKFSKTPATGGVRFAPSPTGKFHIGNLRTAWVSHLIARQLSLPWIVRFEDIDKPRVLAGAQEEQLKDLMFLGLKPGYIFVQSNFHERHRDLFLRAVKDGVVYACDCSRKDVQTALAELASAPHSGVAPVYSGRCRQLCEIRDRELQAVDSIAWRIKMPNEDGHNDFIVARTPLYAYKQDVSSSDFVPAYHWACAIDDFDGRYDWIVRSSDLASALTLQRAIQRWLAKTEGQPAFVPKAFHTSLVTQDDGHRLEKRTKGVTLQELVSQGYDAKKIVKLFERSFDSGLIAQLSTLHDVDVVVESAAGEVSVQAPGPAPGVSSKGTYCETHSTLKLSDLLKG